MASAILLVNLARAKLANATRRVCVAADAPIYNSMTAINSNRKATTQRHVAREVASTRPRKISYAVKPVGTRSFPNGLRLVSPTHQDANQVIYTRIQYLVVKVWTWRWTGGYVNGNGIRLPGFKICG
jgi:hypothetical protein